VYVRFHVPGRRGLLVADAFGLAFFTIGGAQIAEQAGLSGLLAVLVRFAAILWRLELPVLSLEETESGSIRRPERK
jgi:uncharacterized membrane protein YeiH